MVGIRLKIYTDHKLGNLPTNQFKIGNLGSNDEKKFKFKFKFKFQINLAIY